MVADIFLEVNTNIMNIKTRSAEIDDLSTLYEFEQGIINAERPFDPTLKTTHLNYYDLQSLVLSDDAQVVVAFTSERLIGSGYIKIQQAKPYLQFEKYGYIGFMFVAPDFRGQGVSSLILNSLKSWARSQNLSEVRLEVYAENQQAMRAYEKAGFSANMLEMRLGL